MVSPRLQQQGMRLRDAMGRSIMSLKCPRKPRISYEVYFDWDWFWIDRVAEYFDSLQSLWFILDRELEALQIT